MDEFDLIDRFFKGRTGPRADTLLGIGDDAAILATDGRPLISAMAALNPMPATKGDPRREPRRGEGAGDARAVFAAALIRLALRRIPPRWVTLALSLESVDEERSIAWLESFACGMDEICRACEVELVGGDTTRGANRIVVFALGFSSSPPEPPEPTECPTLEQGPAAQEGKALIEASENPAGGFPDTLRLGFTGFSSVAVSDLIGLYRSPVADRLGPSIFRSLDDDSRAFSGDGSLVGSLVASIDIRCDGKGKEALRRYAARHDEVVELS